MFKVVVPAAAGATQVSGSLVEPNSTTDITYCPTQGSVSPPVPSPRPHTRLHDLREYLEIWGDFGHLLGMCDCPVQHVSTGNACLTSPAICKTLGGGPTHTQATRG
jgi:hypothetical protein